jgi:hypothetical protein
LRFPASDLYVHLIMSESDASRSLSQRNGSDINWPEIRAAAIALGVREAARQAAKHLPPLEQQRFVNRVMRRCSRERWLAIKRNPPPPTVPFAGQTLPMSARVRDGSAVLAQTLQERKDKSALHLSKYIQDASARLEQSGGDLLQSKAGSDVVKIRQGIYPETREATELEVTINLDNQARVEQMHARLRSLLGADSVS